METAKLPSSSGSSPAAGLGSILSSIGSLFSGRGGGGGSGGGGNGSGSGSSTSDPGTSGSGDTITGGGGGETSYTSYAGTGTGSTGGGGAADYYRGGTVELPHGLYPPDAYWGPPGKRKRFGQGGMPYETGQSSLDIPDTASTAPALQNPSLSSSGPSGLGQLGGLAGTASNIAGLAGFLQRGGRVGYADGGAPDDVPSDYNYGADQTDFPVDDAGIDRSRLNGFLSSLKDKDPSFWVPRASGLAAMGTEFDGPRQRGGRVGYADGGAPDDVPSDYNYGADQTDFPIDMVAPPGALAYQHPQNLKGEQVPPAPRAEPAAPDPGLWGGVKHFLGNAADELRHGDFTRNWPSNPNVDDAGIDRSRLLTGQDHLPAPTPGLGGSTHAPPPGATTPTPSPFVQRNAGAVEPSAPDPGAPTPVALGAAPDISHDVAPTVPPTVPPTTGSRASSGSPDGGSWLHGFLSSLKDKDSSFWVPLASGIAAMGTAPTRHFGVAAAAGLGAAAQSYLPAQQEAANIAETKAGIGSQMFRVASQGAPPGTRAVQGPGRQGQKTFQTPDGAVWHYELTTDLTDYGGAPASGASAPSATPASGASAPGVAHRSAIERNADGSLKIGPSTETDNLMASQYGYDFSRQPVANLRSAIAKGHGELAQSPESLQHNTDARNQAAYLADDSERQLVQLARSVNSLSDGTLTGRGPMASERQTLANVYNYAVKLISHASGANISDYADPKDLTEQQIIDKINGLQAPQLAQQYGERAASVAASLKTVLPGAGMTRVAANTNLAQMMVQTQRARDLRDYGNDYVSRYGTDARLEENFNRDTQEQYAREKAILPKMFDTRTKSGTSRFEEFMKNPSAERKLKLELGAKARDGTPLQGLGAGATRYLF